MIEDYEGTKARILQVLGSGKAQRRKGPVLAQVVGSDLRGDTNFRAIVRDLIEEGHPIASVAGKRGGFFLAITKEEVQEYADSLRSRLIKDALRRRDFLRAARDILDPVQLTMPLDSCMNGPDKHYMRPGKGGAIVTMTRWEHLREHGINTEGGTHDGS